VTVSLQGNGTSRRIPLRSLTLSASESSEGRPVVRTIGHGTRTTDELAALLSAAGVATLIDVRRYPAGRRQPHLSRERLAADLPERGVAYEWWGEALGGRRAVTPASLADSSWRSPAFAAYGAYMSTTAFSGALEELERRASAGEPLAIMCAETVWWRCHRRLIADALTLDGFGVEHLIDRVPGRPHQLSGPAQRHSAGFVAARVARAPLEGDVMSDDLGRLRRRPVERFAGAIHVFDLPAMAGKLRREPDEPSDGHRQITLFHEGDLAIVLFDFEAGGLFSDHEANGDVTIYVVAGELEVTTPEAKHRLPAGGLIVLAPGVRHDVTARVASQMLLMVHLVPRAEQ
jgi:quercetin dioxygenase-like cupin family protein